MCVFSDEHLVMAIELVRYSLGKAISPSQHSLVTVILCAGLRLSPIQFKCLFVQQMMKEIIKRRKIQ